MQFLNHGNIWDCKKWNILHILLQISSTNMTLISFSLVVILLSSFYTCSSFGIAGSGFVQTRIFNRAVSLRGGANAGCGEPSAYKPQSFTTHLSSHGSGSVDGEDQAVAQPLRADMSSIKEGIKALSLDGSEVRVGILMARWNADVISGLYQGVNQTLTECGVKPSNVFTAFVPGAYELPVTAKLLAASKRVDVIINLACLIKGETMHFEYISGAVADGLMRVSLDTMVPCVFGVLTVLNKQQAIKRSTGATNEGLSWGRSAVEMGLNRLAALGSSSVKTADAANPFVTFQTLPHSEKKDNKDNKDEKIGF